MTGRLWFSVWQFASRMFQNSSTIGLPRHRIDVTLSDERNVPADHAASNEKLLRENLISLKPAAQLLHLSGGHWPTVALGLQSHRYG